MQTQEPTTITPKSEGLQTDEIHIERLVLKVLRKRIGRTLPNGIFQAYGPKADYVV
jgi:hypothetical protein